MLSVFAFPQSCDIACLPTHPPMLPGASSEMVNRRDSVLRLCVFDSVTFFRSMLIENLSWFQNLDEKEYTLQIISPQSSRSLVLLNWY